MPALENLKVELTVVLGRARMPIHTLLRMGRGAVIELEATETDTVEILANGHPVARGHIMLVGNRITIEVTESIRKPTIVREPGALISQSAATLASTDA